MEALYVAIPLLRLTVTVGVPAPGDTVSTSAVKVTLLDLTDFDHEHVTLVRGLALFTA
jgi:hypothetical protein